MDGYFVADWVTVFPVTSKLELTLRVDNIFDASYQEFPGVEQPGFTVFVGFDVTL